MGVRTPVLVLNRFVETEILSTYYTYINTNNTRVYLPAPLPFHLHIAILYLFIYICIAIYIEAVEHHACAN
jgi:hypothetical protein